VTALQEVISKEMKKRRHKDKSKDHEGLTSVHHIAAEAAIRKIRRVIVRKRRAQYIIDN
jgi:hypothetical protein